MRKAIEKEIVATAKAAQAEEIRMRETRRVNIGPSPSTESLVARGVALNNIRTSLYHAEGKLVAFVQLFGRKAVCDLLLADPTITHIPPCVIATKRL